MEDRYLKEELLRLINEYVKNDEKRKEFQQHVKQNNIPPVRGIFSEMKKMGIKFDSKEGDLIRDIFFYYG